MCLSPSYLLIGSSSDVSSLYAGRGESPWRPCPLDRRSAARGSIRRLLDLLKVPYLAVQSQFEFVANISVPTVRQREVARPTSSGGQQWRRSVQAIMLLLGLALAASGGAYDSGPRQNHFQDGTISGHGRIVAQQINIVTKRPGASATSGRRRRGRDRRQDASDIDTQNSSQCALRTRRESPISRVN